MPQPRRGTINFYAPQISPAVSKPLYPGNCLEILTFITLYLPPDIALYTFTRQQREGTWYMTTVIIEDTDGRVCTAYVIAVLSLSGFL